MTLRAYLMAGGLIATILSLAALTIYYDDSEFVSASSPTFEFASIGKLSPTFIFNVFVNIIYCIEVHESGIKPDSLP
jgi:hypothetical protein